MVAPSSEPHRGRYRADEPFRAGTSKQAIDKGLLVRWKALQAAKQRRVGAIRTVTLNEILSDMLDLAEGTGQMIEDARNHE